MTFKKWQKSIQTVHRGFASFLSSGFITAIVVNSIEIRVESKNQLQVESGMTGCLILKRVFLNDSEGVEESIIFLNHGVWWLQE